MKSVQILSFFLSIFSRIWTECIDLLRKSPYSVQMWKNVDQKKIRYLDNFHAFLMWKIKILVYINSRVFVVIVTICWFPAGIYLFKVNSKNTIKRCEICSKLRIKTPERRHWLHSSVFIVKFQNISHIFPVFLLLNLNSWMFAGCFFFFLLFLFLFIWLFYLGCNTFFNLKEDHFPMFHELKTVSTWNLLLHWNKDVN